MRVLIIGEEQKLAAHELAEFAAKPENHYRPGPGVPPPGDDPRFVIRFGLREDFRCVFSFTAVDSMLFRHLSIAVPGLMIGAPGENPLPHPAMVTEIAHLFGFKGDFSDWRVTIEPIGGTPEKPHGAVVVAQRVS